MKNFNELKEIINAKPIYSFKNRANGNVEKIIDMNIGLISSALDACLIKEKLKKNVSYISIELFYIVNKFSNILTHLKTEHYSSLDFYISFINNSIYLWYSTNLNYDTNDIKKYIQGLHELNESTLEGLRKKRKWILENPGTKDSYIPLGLLDLMRKVERPFGFNILKEKQAKIEFIFRAIE